MNTSNSGAYFKYAIGEIILVVIGILIAVQINNWSEQAKSQQQVNAIFGEILLELSHDLQQVNRVIQFYELKDSLIHNVLQGKVREADYEGQNEYLSLILNRRFVRLNTNGFENLMLHIDKIPAEHDEIVPQLKNIYVRSRNRMNDFQQKTGEIIDKTLERYALNYDWFALSNEEQDRQAWVNYQLSDPKYKNEVKLYQIITLRNLLGILNQFRRDGTTVYKILYEALGSEEPIPDFMIELMQE